MKATQKTICALSILTGSGILFQWILVWAGIFAVEETVPGFRNYFLSFQVADLYLVLLAFLTAIFVLRRDPKALLFEIALGSAMVFFGLYSLLYDINTGLFFDFSIGELFGKIVTFYNIFIGLSFIILGWKDWQIEK